jgi:hypothetical protein
LNLGHAKGKEKKDTRPNNWNPSLNPEADRVFIPRIKFRLAY